MNDDFSLQLTVDQIDRRTQQICAKLQQVSKAVREMQPENFKNSPLTAFESSFVRWHETEGRAAEWACQCVLGSMVHSGSDRRAAFSEAKLRLKQEWDTCYNDREVYRVLNAVYELLLKSTQTDFDDGLLNVVDRRMIDRTLQLFRRNGAALPLAKAEQLRKVKQEISRLEMEFQRNINEDNTVAEYTAEQLRGVPKTFLSQLEKTYKPPVEYYQVNCKAPHMQQIMRRCTVAETRRNHLTVANRRCAAQNMPVLVDLIRLRREAALLLGFNSWADFKIADNMAGSSQSVDTLIHELIGKLKPGLQTDLSLMLKLKQTSLQPATKDDSKTSGVVNTWDVSFLETLLIEEEYEVDLENIREYFPLDFVIERVLGIYQYLFSLLFVEIVGEERAATVWHPDVRAFRVYDSAQVPQQESAVLQQDQRRLIGTFYLDLFSRPGKYSHQCVLPIRPSHEQTTITDEGNIVKQFVPPAAANISNLTRPTADDQPSLLHHSEVRTFFHEFGHVMHCVCTRSPYTLFSWAWNAVPYAGGVENDFLEVPSQMLENWMWEQEIIQHISLAPKSRQKVSASAATPTNYSSNTAATQSTFEIHKSPDPLPPKYAQSLIKTRLALSAYHYSRQLFMTLFDLRIHSLTANDKLPSAEELQVMWQEMSRSITGLPSIVGTQPMASWYHVAMGYDAGYYGYLWSEVVSLDMYFSRWRKAENGCLDRQVGAEFRRLVLEPGASRSGQQMTEAFLGRPPSTDALLQLLGLSTIKPSSGSDTKAFHN